MLCDSIITRWFHESMCDTYVVPDLPCVVPCKVGDNENLVFMFVRQSFPGSGPCCNDDEATIVAPACPLPHVLWWLANVPYFVGLHLWRLWCAVPSRSHSLSNMIHFFLMSVTAVGDEWCCPQLVASVPGPSVHDGLCKRGGPSQCVTLWITW